MSTYTQIYYHIVFTTKNRTPVLFPDRREDLFRYIGGVIRGHKCHPYAINGIADHIHILTSLHSTVCLADLVKDIKLASSGWMVHQGDAFLGFRRWQDGSGAFTCSSKEASWITDYIHSQEEHHKRESPLEEMRRLLTEAGIPFDEKYLE
jgi:REP element-mobilizing transposase RayT